MVYSSRTGDEKHQLAMDRHGVSGAAMRAAMSEGSGMEVDEMEATVAPSTRR